MSERRLLAQRSNSAVSVAAKLARRVHKSCEFCLDDFTVTPSAARRAPCRFCSNQCRYESMRGANGANAGGGAAITGERNPNWRGGIADRRKAEWARDARVFVWRREVLRRCRSRCVRCGIHRLKARVEAHHIHSWAMYPERRFEPENGVALCRQCHRWVHSTSNQERLWLPPQVVEAIGRVILSINQPEAA